MVKLICDLNIKLRGHNAGHIQYIIDNIESKDDEIIYFLLNKSAKLIIDISNSKIENKNFFFSENDFEENSLFEKLKFDEWRVVNKYANQLSIDKLFIMELTRYEVQIGKSKVKYRISGIEFRPSHRITASNKNFSTLLKAGFKKTKKRFFELILLRSSALENIFIFNDPKGADLLNKIYASNVFKSLVDPIYEYPPLSDKELEKIPYTNQHRVVFLIFGAISWRKNIKNIMKAFSLVSKSLHNKLSLLIVGRIPSSFATEFELLTAEFKQLNPEIELLVVNDFVSDSHMEYYFSISNVSLCIYSDFYGSSGLLGRAAKHDIISLVPNVGLMAEMCNEYDLGYLCDPNSPEDINNNIYKAYHAVTNNIKINGSKFYESHSPVQFLKGLPFY